MNLHPLFNEAPLARETADLRPGVIALANESRITSATYSEPLTAYTVGWRDPENLIDALEYIAPAVPVSRRFEFKKADNAEVFLSESDDIRAIGADFKRVEYKGSTVMEKTINKGLTYLLDTDEEGGVVTEEMIVGRLLQRLNRNEYRRAVPMLLASGGAGTAKTWSAATAPDEDMRQALADAQLAGGIFPNRGLVGLVAWNLRANAMALSDKAGAFAGLSKSPKEVGQALGLEDMRTSQVLFQSTTVGKSRVVGSNFIGFTGYSGIGKDDPSTLKRFYTPAGSGLYRVYREEKAKFIQITVEHYSNVVATAAVGVARLNIS